MPVEFLTDEQAAAYGRFNGPPTRPQLERFFFLDDADRALVGRRLGDHKLLGFALQAMTARYLGVFLADPIDVPSEVLDYLAGQLGITDASCVKRYSQRETTHREHAEEIQREYGLRDFSEVEAEQVGWVDARAWTTGEGPKATFDGAVPGCGSGACCCPGCPRWPGWWPGYRGAGNKRVTSRHILRAGALASAPHVASRPGSHRASYLGPALAEGLVPIESGSSAR
jgi:hypothetical protein